ncbi:mas-related G-protein coupled receptor member X2-like [Phascolarctos cinereus]|uniref:Mas-related G-protein coupled receptor member X2-like n=1 Tax=Phascolarctos cinereus TaxID=38626 RepID=A0A6P5IZJ6_PHACI|nr:mas-related G-protein coupled receptor member X2-like [Phascolarctos cinereus]
MAQFSTKSPWDQGYDNRIEVMRTELPQSPGNVTSEGTFSLVLPYLVLVISLGGLVGNGIVLWILSFRIKKSPFSIYILNLAGADFLHLACWTLFAIGFFSQILFISVSVVITFITLIFYNVGLSFLVAISTERCLSVLFPIWYRCLRPRHMSATVCTLIWALYILLFAVMGLTCVHLGHGPCYGFVVTTSVWVLLLIGMMSVSSLTLLLRVQCSFQQRQPPRLYILIVLTVLLFFLCGLPFGILLLMQYLEFNFPYMLNFYELSLLLSTLNSSVNPLIYFFVGSFRQKRLRESFVVVLQRMLGEEAEMDEGQETASIGPMEMTP